MSQLQYTERNITEALKVKELSRSVMSNSLRPREL